MTSSSWDAFAEPVTPRPPIVIERCEWCGTQPPRHNNSALCTDCWRLFVVPQRVEFYGQVAPTTRRPSSATGPRQATARRCSTEPTRTDPTTDTEE